MAKRLPIEYKLVGERIVTPPEKREAAKQRFVRAMLSFYEEIQAKEQTGKNEPEKVG